MLPRMLRVSLCFAVVAAVVLVEPAHAADKIVHFRIAGRMNEAPSEVDLGALLGGGGPKSFLELIDRLRDAAEDAEVKAVVLTIDAPQAGLSQIMELCDAVDQLRAAGKEVYCHSEVLGLGTYLLAARCSHLVMVPTGELMLLGIRSEIGFYKGLLDKLGIRADMIHIGAYKGAAEPFTRAEPSPEFREQMERLLGDVYDQVVSQIAESRSLTKDKAVALVDQGPYTAEWAHEAGLIDEVAYRKDFVDDVKKRYPGAEIDNDYGRPKAPEIDFSNPFTLITQIMELLEEAQAPSKPSVAVVYVDGMIWPGKSEQNPLMGGLVGSTTVRHALEKAAADPMIKAVVLRVDSPGGSALASEIIWKATQRVIEQKPLVVSMGNVAGSGGYYVSCGGRTIFADPTTITGSIGVVGGKLVLQGLWDKLGITTYTVSYGANAGLFSTERSFTDEERAKVHDLMEFSYDTFKSHVRDGRGEHLTGDLENLAGGRVYTGREALEIGLVDRLGGLHEAIRYAASLAHIGEYEVRVLPKPKTLMDILIEAVRGESDEDKLILDRVQALVGHPVLHPGAESLRVLDAEAFDGLVRAIQRIMLFRREAVLTVMPFDLRLH